MKTILFVSLFLTTTAFAQHAPDFKRIFSEIEKTNTVTEAISVREAYVTQMRNMDDFNQLTNYEKLTGGQEFFGHYQLRMADFIKNNVGNFINPDRKNEVNTFTQKVYAKVKKTEQAFEVAKLGLAYIQGCEDFKRYVSQTEPMLQHLYIKDYCKKASSPSTSELVNVLVHPRTLLEGRWDTVKFNYTYIKKIYISAEGIGRDAYFDVMVNGDVKGTIYVPGRGPSYVITVEDYADTVLLRSLSGNARILSIVLDVQ